MIHNVVIHATKLHRFAKCSFYLAYKRKEIFLVNNIRGVVPYFADVSVTEVNHDGQVDYIAFFTSHIEYYFLTWVMLYVIDFAFEKSKWNEEKKY